MPSPGRPWGEAAWETLPAPRGSPPPPAVLPCEIPEAIACLQLDRRQQQQQQQQQQQRQQYPKALEALEGRLGQQLDRVESLLYCVWTATSKCVTECEAGRRPPDLYRPDVKPQYQAGGKDCSQAGTGDANPFGQVAHSLSVVGGGLDDLWDSQHAELVALRVDTLRAPEAVKAKTNFRKMHKLINTWTPIQTGLPEMDDFVNSWMYSLDTQASTGCQPGKAACNIEQLAGALDEVEAAVVVADPQESESPPPPRQSLHSLQSQPRGSIQERRERKSTKIAERASQRASETDLADLALIAELHGCGSGEPESNGVETHLSEVFMTAASSRRRVLATKFYEWMAAPEPERTGFLAGVIRSSYFERLSLLLILLNTVYTAYMTNRFASMIDAKATTTTFVIDHAFLGCFTFELLLKFMVHRGYVYTNQDYAWNIFDSTIVFFSWFELVMEMAGLSAIDVSFMRVYRVFRVTRVLRIFRAFKFLNELRLMVSCLLGSMMSLFWCSVLLFIILLIAALIFVQMVSQFRVDSPEVIAADAYLQFTIDQHFGSIGSAMVSLLKATTGGMDWGILHEVILRTGMLGGSFYVIYIVFFTFAFFNIVTSVFVDNAMKLAVPDNEVLMLEKRREDKKIAEELTALIEQLDPDDTGMISYAEMIRLEANPDIRGCLELAGINIVDINSFFETLVRISGTSVIEIGSFVGTCMQMKGYATSLDMQTVLYQIHEMSASLHQVGEHLGIHTRASEAQHRKSQANADG